jgi:electron transport complex protein RnfG
MKQIWDDWRDFNTLKGSIRYQSMLLAVTCGLAAMLLLANESLTRPEIAKRIAEDQQTLLNQVLAGMSYANDVFAAGRSVVYQGQSYSIYPVINADGAMIAHVIRGQTEGYGGPIRYLIGVNLDGVIQGVRIISHSETPGLGDRIELAKSHWILSFNQRSLSNTPLWAVRKDGGNFDQFSGATITPRSVVRGVHLALLALDRLTKE